RRGEMARIVGHIARRVVRSRRRCGRRLVLGLLGVLSTDLPPGIVVHHPLLREHWRRMSSFDVAKLQKVTDLRKLFYVTAVHQRGEAADRVGGACIQSRSTAPPSGER